MRHTVHILVGDAMSRFSQRINAFVNRYGIFDEGKYIQVYSFDSNGMTAAQPIGETPQAAVKLDGDEVGIKWFDELFRSTMTIAYDDDFPSELYVCLYVPIYDKEAWNLAKQLLDYSNKTDRRVIVDVIGLADDISAVLSNDAATSASTLRQEMQSALREAVALEKSGKLHRLLFVQNSNEDRRSLNLDESSLTAILGEYMMLATDCYTSIYLSNDLDIPEVTAIGIASMLFDKEFFVDYMLRKAFVHVLEREGVDKTAVDSNRVSQLVYEKLSGRTDVFGRFYDTEVRPMVKQQTLQNLSDNEIIAKANEKLKPIIDELRSHFTDFMEREDLTLPEKRAAFAQLLGVDDELLSEYLYSKDQYEFDDCFESAMKEFVAEDNDNVVIETDAEGREIRDDEGGYVAHGGTLAGSNRSGGQNAVSLKEIKALKADIKQITAYIRNKTRDLEELNSDANDGQIHERVISKSGFRYNGVLYTLQDDGDVEPLELNYMPLREAAKEAVDLRYGFSQVRDQGQEGSCVAFATTSIFEYFLNSIQGVDDSSLSPRFLYYHIGERGEDGRFSGKGSSFCKAIESLTENGVCEERYCRYDEDANTAPSAEAVENAKQYKVVEALNVRVDHDTITSALSDGFPVAVSLRIFDSFGSSKGGFVFNPTPEEVAEEDKHYHAMVIVGYLKDAPVYIVRNSWGKQFGDKGYCYVPFSYIDNPDYCRQALIITEVSSGSLKKIVSKTQTTSQFDRTDHMVSYALLRIELDDMAVRLKDKEQEYSYYKRAFTQHRIELGNPVKRDSIVKYALNRKRAMIETMNEAYDKKVNEERPEILKNLRIRQRRNLIRWGVTAVFLICVTVLLFRFVYGEFGTFGDRASWTALGLSVLATILVILLIPFYKNRYKVKKEELTEECELLRCRIAQKESEIFEFGVRMHVAGLIIDALESIKRTIEKDYAALKLYVTNLSTWLDEERLKMDEKKQMFKDPFMPIISQEKLNAYFADSKDSMTRGIRLYEQFRNYDIDNMTFHAFKEHILTQLTGSELEKNVKDFSMFAYLLGKKKFGYLPDADALQTVVNNLERKGRVFCEYNSIRIDNLLQTCLLLKVADDQEATEWHEHYSPCFQQTPNTSNMSIPNEIVLIQQRKLKLDELDVMKSSAIVE